ncbi:chorion peroxidase-like isoform X2 [Schistocerca gregaria]|uniref:chorion peroxidase-like isoform X2 n=1 Tax=Schistocerca gregaria TaxID=7010 RepID=UPI00211F1BCB|nr:chorion peroxidase-like isoform X2 [Schistocerca gregaria]
MASRLLVLLLVAAAGAEEVAFPREAVQRAADVGLSRMRYLVQQREPSLYRMGMRVERGSPAHYVSAFSGPATERAQQLARYGYAAMEAAAELLANRSLHTHRGSRGWSQPPQLWLVSLRDTALHDGCPAARPPPCPTRAHLIRTVDGRCNNPAHPTWGSALQPLRRLLPPAYADGLEKIRQSVSGGPLPSARLVSTAVHSDRHVNLSSITHMLMQWGQFLDHDLTASSQTRGFNGSVPKCCSDRGHSFLPENLTHPDCLPIEVPPTDYFYQRYHVRCLEFVRSSAVPKVDCSLGARDQINQVTSFLDASNVYGSSEDAASALRLYRNGFLRYTRMQSRLPLPPPATGHSSPELCRYNSGVRCFSAGDHRVNEQPGLIAMHTLWLRAHNNLATKLIGINPHWDDERIYQEARKIIGAMMQHITYREFLPIVLGQDVIKLFELNLTQKGYYKGYHIKVNPTALNAFATAAFRFGHSLVQPSLLRCDSRHRLLPFNASLHEELTVPTDIYNTGSVDQLLLGMCVQPAQKRDEYITEQLTNHLFQTPSYHYGMDLAALNIQRGRDHGLPPYNSWRTRCGLQSFSDWDQLLKVMSPETVVKLRKVYSDTDDIDLFAGGMAEKPVYGGLVGPTFACIIAQQFSNLRKGDRFWYENGGFDSSLTLPQLQQIRHVTLARVLCDNLDTIDTVQPFVFLAADNDRNRHVPCHSWHIPKLDLSPWREHNKNDNYAEEEYTLELPIRRPDDNSYLKPPKNGNNYYSTDLDKYNSPNHTETQGYTPANHLKPDNMQSPSYSTTQEKYGSSTDRGEILSNFNKKPEEHYHQPNIKLNEEPSLHTQNHRNPIQIIPVYHYTTTHSTNPDDKISSAHIHPSHISLLNTVNPAGDSNTERNGLPFPDSHLSGNFYVSSKLDEELFTTSMTSQQKEPFKHSVLHHTISEGTSKMVTGSNSFQEYNLENSQSSPLKLHLSTTQTGQRYSSKNNSFLPLTSGPEKPYIEEDSSLHTKGTDCGHNSAADIETDHKETNKSEVQNRITHNLTTQNIPSTEKETATLGEDSTRTTLLKSKDPLFSLARKETELPSSRLGDLCPEHLQQEFNGEIPLPASDPLSLQEFPQPLQENYDMVEEESSAHGS